MGGNFLLPVHNHSWSDAVVDAADTEMDPKHWFSDLTGLGFLPRLD